MVHKEDVMSHMKGGVAMNIVGAIIGAIVIHPMVLMLQILSLAAYYDMSRKIEKLDV